MSKAKPSTPKFLAGWPLVAIVAVVVLLCVMHLYTKPTLHRLGHYHTNSQLSGILRYEIREDSGSTPVNAAQVRGTYNTDQLEFIGVDNLNSSFSVAAEGKGDGGTFSIGRGSTTSITGDRLVATLLFRPKATNIDPVVEVTAADTILVATQSTANIVGQPGVKVYVKEAK